MEHDNMDPIRFDDFEALRGQITDEYGDWGGEVTVTQKMINDFAELTGDHQWIHIDVERANAESPFGGPIAHGFLTLSLLPVLMPPTVPLAGITNAVNFGAKGLRFLSPVPAEATVHAKARLTDVEEHRAGTLLTSDVSVHVIDVDKPAIVYQMQTLYQG
jgi:acyl dehydratase